MQGHPYTFQFLVDFLTDPSSKRAFAQFIPAIVRVLTVTSEHV